MTEFNMEFESYLNNSMELLSNSEDLEYTPTTLTVGLGDNVFKCNTAMTELDNTIKVRHGNKIFSYSVDKVEEEFDIETIKSEVKELYSKRLGEIRTKISEYIQEFKFIYDKEKKKVEDAKNELEERLNSTNIMPDITDHHLRQGLSVVKRENGKGFVWMYRTIYYPKVYNGRIIDPAQSKKMITPINIAITTEGKNITNVVVMRSVGWDKFEHYHSMGASSDCWGDWKPSTHTYETPDDIIEIGKHASAVLERINPHSFGNRSPKGLPRPATIEKYLLAEDTNFNGVYGDDINASRDNERSGVTNDVLSQNTRMNNIWHA